MFVNQNQKFLLSLWVLKQLHIVQLYFCAHQIYSNNLINNNSQLWQTRSFLSLAGLLCVLSFVSVGSSLTFEKYVQLKGKEMVLVCWGFFYSA